MKLYTKRGDEGKTSLFDGSEVRKDHARVEAYGGIDELNSFMGVAIAMADERKPFVEATVLIERMQLIQSELFHLGADLATPEDTRRRDRVPAIGDAEPKRLEGWIDEASAAAPELTSFVLPGGDLLAAQLHVCRTVCRRAERGIVTLMEREAVNPQIVIYMNRLSDLLFAWARWVNAQTGVGDVPWVNPKKA